MVCWVICDGLPVCVGTHKLRPCNSSELLAYQYTKDTLPTSNRYVDARSGDYETQKPATQRQQEAANDIMSDFEMMDETEGNPEVYDESSNSYPDTSTATRRLVEEDQHAKVRHGLMHTQRFKLRLSSRGLDA